MHGYNLIYDHARFDDLELDFDFKNVYKACACFFPQVNSVVFHLLPPMKTPTSHSQQFNQDGKNVRYQLWFA